MKTTNTQAGKPLDQFFQKVGLHIVQKITPLQGDLRSKTTPKKGVES